MLEKIQIRNERVIECFKKSKVALSQSEIVVMTEMSRAAVSCAIEYLLGSKRIKLYRKIGNNILYKLI